MASHASASPDCCREVAARTIVVTAWELQWVVAVERGRARENRAGALPEVGGEFKVRAGEQI